MVKTYMANVDVKALKPLGIKEGKTTVNKTAGETFKMDMKDALAAEKDGAVEILTGENTVDNLPPVNNDSPVVVNDPKEITLLKSKAKEIGIPGYTKMSPETLFNALILKQSEDVAAQSAEQAVDVTTKDHVKLLKIAADSLRVEIDGSLNFADAVEVVINAAAGWKEKAEAVASGDGE
jgi:hypothetical protein